MSHLPPTLAKPRTNWLNRLLAAAVVLALGVLGYHFLTTDQLNEQIRQRVEHKIRTHYAGLHVTLESARRIEGQGIEIRGLTIAEVDRLNEPVLYVERILAVCETSLPEFVTQPIVLKSLLIERAHIRAVRRENGFWNVTHLFPLPVSSRQMPPLKMVRATVEARDEARPGVDPLVLRDIAMTFACDPAAAELLGLPPEHAGEAIRMEGEFNGDHFREIRVAGVLDRKVERWNIAGVLEDLQFSPSLRAALPRDVAEQLAPLSAISGNTHLQFRVDNVSSQESPCHFEVSGNIADGRMVDERLPHALTEISAKISGDNSGLRIDDLRAKWGAAEVDASLRLDGFTSSSPMVLRIGVSELEVNDSYAPLLPDDARPIWQQLGLSGELSGKLILSFDGNHWSPEFDCEISRASLQYEKFPYRITEGHATLKLQNDLFTLRGEGGAGNARVRCAAEIRQPGPDWSGWAEATTEEPIPIDERLLQALEPNARRVVQSFQARGNVKLLARLDRRPQSQRGSHYHLEVALDDCSLNYEKFPYPIDHVHGTLLDTDGAWTFRDLRGTQGTAQIDCSGSFASVPEQGKLLSLDFHATNVALNETLRRALPLENQRLWDDIRPRGELETLGVQLTYSPQQQQLNLLVDAGKLQMANQTARPMRIEPIWFPYALDIIAGTARYRDGVLELNHLRALHDRSKLEADGTFTWDADSRWSLNIARLNADRLQLDHDLLAALPTDVGRALAKAKFVGSLGMTGNLQAAGRAGEAASLNAKWDLKFDVEDGRLAGEVPVEHIHGGIDMQGGVEEGRWASRGEVRLDSAFYRDVQFTRINGPIQVDQQRLLLGSSAERDTAGGSPRSLMAQVCDGLLSIDASVSLEDNGEFKLEGNLDQANLAKISQELHLPAEDITGKAFGILQMTGTTRGKHTWRGGGNVRLRDAYLYKVPAMVALLKLLSVRTPDKTAFNSSDIDYRIQGDDLIFDRLDLSGDVFSLKGRGRLYEQKQIDVLFYTQVGRNEAQWNVIRPLLAEASPHFLLIEVTGTLDHPNMKKTAFPVLNETLREMFPEVAREQSARKK